MPWPMPYCPAPACAKAAKPVATFLFLARPGWARPSSPGIGRIYHGDEHALLRIDMSEYGERHTVARLVARLRAMSVTTKAVSSPEKVRRKPYSVLLLDEIEKAHP